MERWTSLSISVRCSPTLSSNRVSHQRKDFTTASNVGLKVASRTLAKEENSRKMSKRISDPRTMEKFRDWLKDNSLSPGNLDLIDINAEFGTDLTFDEAVQLAVQKFPGIWKSNNSSRDSKPKQIIFVKELVDKISDGSVQVTYRKTAKIGMYYVIDNRFRQRADSAKLLIEFYRTDKVNAYELSDEEARLAGIQSADEIRTLFEKWYGSPIPELFRNWFRVLDN